MNSEQLTDVLVNIADVLEENKEYLTDLDRPIGDGDHGINMARGFEQIKAQADSLKSKDAGGVFKSAGMVLVSKVGGSAGPLYGTAFMKAGGSIGNKAEIDINDFIKAMSAAIDGVKMRGKSTAGEKTMLDAMIPALEAMEKAQSENKDAKAILEAGAEAARAGAEATIPMLATKGRASYLQERSIGHQDPGATSFALMMEEAAKYAG